MKRTYADELFQEGPSDLDLWTWGTFLYQFIKPPKKVP